jgi:hypothetical protein
VLIALLSIGTDGRSAGAEPVAGHDTDVTADAIAGWIEQLDSDLFIEREQATRALRRAGQPAIAALAAAADGDVLEVATRAVRILLELSNERHDDTARAALRQLAQLKHRPAERATAESILNRMRETEALATIVDLGGVEQLRYTVDGRAVVGRLLIGRKWKGGDIGLEHVNCLRGLRILSVHGVPISDAGIARLRGTPALVQIQLFGTNVTSGGAAALAEALPHVKIDYRRGALLGVKGIGGMPDARIAHVVAGSAAAEAGLAVSDVITKFNGRPVTDFQSLTRFVAERKAGEEVDLEVMRGDQRLTVSVTLGAWQ